MSRYPIPSEALDDRLGIVGTAGSGKTYAAGTMVERLLRSKTRVIVLDPLDVWWGLRLLPDGKPSPFDVVIFGGAHGDLPLTEHAGALIGETVARMSESAIVSLGGFTTGASERRFMLAFLTALYRHTPGEPVHVVFDEADMWAPQKVLDKEGDANKLLGMMETLVRRGRVKGFIPWLITQRPAVLSKNVLSQIDALVAMKLTSSQDRDAIGAWVEGSADKAEWLRIWGSLPAMQRGQGLVWVPGRSIMDTVQFPAKATFDSSRTPKRGEAKQTAELAPIDISALKDRLATVEAEVKANDPKVLRAEITTLRRQIASKQGEKVNTVDPQAINDAENRGYMRGQRDEAARHDHLRQSIAVHMTDIRTALGHIENYMVNMGGAEKIAVPRAACAPSRVASIPRETAAHSKGNGTARTGEEVGSGGLRRILVALAQCPAGLTNRQIGVRATLSSKSGTFSTYLSKARSQGWIEGTGRLRITPAGLEALGPYDPLPTGPDLLEHWLRELGDSGAARILRAAADAYPNPLTNAEAGTLANISHVSGTFSTYLSRLRTLELITGRGEIRASEDLFA